MKRLGCVAVVLLLLGSAVLGQEVVRIVEFEPTLTSFDATQIRASGGSREFRAVRDDYLSKVAEIMNGYFDDVTLLGVEPLNLFDLAEMEDGDAYLSALIEGCYVAKELIESEVEQCDVAFADVLRQVRALDRVSATSIDEFAKVDDWALILFGYEEVVVDAKTAILEALYNSIGLWEVRGNSVVFEAEAADYADFIKAYLRLLKELESVAKQYEIRGGLQAMDALRAGDCWNDLERVVLRR